MICHMHKVILVGYVPVEALRLVSCPTRIIREILEVAASGSRDLHIIEKASPVTQHDNGMAVVAGRDRMCTRVPQLPVKIEVDNAVGARVIFPTCQPSPFWMERTGLLSTCLFRYRPRPASR